MKTPKTIAFVTVLLSIFFAAQFAAAGQWLHVSVEEKDDDEVVKVNIPLALVKVMLPKIERERPRARLRWNRHRDQLSLEDLREMWEAAKEAGDFDFVSIEGRRRNQSVRVGIQGDYLVAYSTDDSDDQVDVRIPIRVVDALFSGDEDELNLTAAFEIFSQLGDEQFISVQDSHSKVRVWVNDRPGQ